MVVMDPTQCVTWLLGAQVKVLSGSYEHKSKRYFVVMDTTQCVARDASQWTIWLLWTHLNESPDC